MQLAITFEASNKSLVGEKNVTVSRKSERHQIETLIWYLISFRKKDYTSQLLVSSAQK